MTDLNQQHSYTQQEIEKVVLTVISEKIGVGLDSIKVSDHLFDDLNASKLEKAEIIASLEDKYHIIFNSEELPQLNTPSNIIEYLTDNVE